MPKVSEKHKQNSIRYAKEHLKRVPLDMQLWQYDRLKAAASAAGESVNGYIKKAIAMRMQSDHFDGSPDSDGEGTK